MMDDTLKIDERGGASGGITNSQLGGLIFLSAEAMLFAGLLGAYVVLRSGAPHVLPESGSNSLIRFGIGAVALCGLEIARRYGPGETGTAVTRRGRIVALWGAGLALPAAVAWLVAASDTILGWEGGSFHDLALLSPVLGCRLFLHTLLALHILITLLLTGLGVWGILRSSPNVADQGLRGELLWGFTLAVQIAFAGLGV